MDKGSLHTHGETTGRASILWHLHAGKPGEFCPDHGSSHVLTAIVNDNDFIYRMRLRLKGTKGGAQLVWPVVSDNNSCYGLAP
jgi:hypothetical protein